LHGFTWPAAASIAAAVDSFGQFLDTSKWGAVNTVTKSERISADEVRALWEQYHATGDRRTRNRLVLTFAPMVKYIVHEKIREIPARCAVEDLIACGLEALIKSIDRYDPAKGATLEQFAWTRVHGAVLDDLRRHDRARSDVGTPASSSSPRTAAGRRFRSSPTPTVQQTDAPQLRTRRMPIARRRQSTPQPSRPPARLV
jgi:RNA polymerase sigma factor FliA